MSATFILMIVRFTRTMRDVLRDRELRSLLTFLVILLISGSIFYHFVEHWKYLDALYFSVTTLSTVGAGGQLVPSTDAGKIFTIIYVFLGIGTMLRFIVALSGHAKREGAVQTLLGVDPYAETKKFFQSTKRNAPVESVSNVHV
jgi:hypothetical protein